MNCDYELNDDDDDDGECRTKHECQLVVHAYPVQYYKMYLKYANSILAKIFKLIVSFVWIFKFISSFSTHKSNKVLNKFRVYFQFSPPQLISHFKMHFTLIRHITSIN